MLRSYLGRVGKVRVGMVGVLGFLGVLGGGIGEGKVVQGISGQVAATEAAPVSLEAPPQAGQTGSWDAAKVDSWASGQIGTPVSTPPGSPAPDRGGDPPAHRRASDPPEVSGVQEVVGKWYTSEHPEASGEQEAVAALRALGASVKTDAQGRVVLVDLGSGKATDQAAKHLVRLSQLRSLRWTGPEVTDAVVDALVGLPNLKVLKLDETRLTDAGLARLKNLSPLEELYLARTLITDTGLAHVGQMGGLRRLRLSETKITGAGLAQLAGLRELVELDISRTAVDDASLAVLTKLPKLTRLNLYTTPITDAGLEHLAQMTELSWLNLDNTQVTDAGVPKLRSLKKLEFLHLGRTHITDAGLAPLAELKSLKTLHLTNTAVTTEAAARLQKLLPECKILAGATGESKPAEPTKPVPPSAGPPQPIPPSAGQAKPSEPSKSPACKESPSAEAAPPVAPAKHHPASLLKPSGPWWGPVGQSSKPTGSSGGQLRGVQVRLACTVRQYDPAKPEGLLIGVVENLSAQPVEIPSGYESQRLLLWAKADQHPMPSAYWDRSRQKPPIPLVRLAPGQKQEVFRWPLAEVLADRHQTWRTDFQAGKRLLVWDWEHHAHPPYSPIYRVNSTQCVPKTYFWLELKLDGQTLRSEHVCLEVHPSADRSAARTKDPNVPKNGT